VGRGFEVSISIRKMKMEDVSFVQIGELIFYFNFSVHNIRFVQLRCVIHKTELSVYI
jgi:hypothetical protein